MQDPERTRRTYVAIMLVLLFYGSAYYYCREEKLIRIEMIVPPLTQNSDNSTDEIWLETKCTASYGPLKVCFFPPIWLESQLRILFEEKRLRRVRKP